MYFCLYFRIHKIITNIFILDSTLLSTWYKSQRNAKSAKYGIISRSKRCSIAMLCVKVYTVMESGELQYTDMCVNI